MCRWLCLSFILFYLPNHQILAVGFIVDGPNKTDNSLKTTIDHEEWTKHELKEVTLPVFETVSSNATIQNNAATDGEVSDITRIPKLESITERNHDVDTSEASQKAESSKANKKYTTQQTTVEIESIIKDINYIKSVRDKQEMKVNSSNETITKHHGVYNIKFSQIRRAREIDNTKIAKFLVYIYDSSLRNLNNLHDQIDESDLHELINQAIDSFKTDFKQHVDKIGTTDLLIDKILILLDVMIFIKEFADQMTSLAIIKASEVKSGLKIERAIQDSFGRLLKEENEHICKEFGVCRNADSFRNFFTGFVEIIKKASTDKMYSAMQAMSGQGQQSASVPSWVKPLVVKAFWGGMSLAMKTPNGLFYNVKVSDLDKKIPANAGNVALWKKMTTDIKSFTEDKIKNPEPIFKDFWNQMNAHGVGKG